MSALWPRPKVNHASVLLECTPTAGLLQVQIRDYVTYRAPNGPIWMLELPPPGTGLGSSAEFTGPSGRPTRPKTHEGVVRPDPSLGAVVLGLR